MLHENTGPSFLHFQTCLHTSLTLWQCCRMVTHLPLLFWIRVKVIWVVWLFLQLHWAQDAATDEEVRKCIVVLKRLNPYKGLQRAHKNHLEGSVVAQSLLFFCVVRGTFKAISHREQKEKEQQSCHSTMQMFILPLTESLQLARWFVYNCSNKVYVKRSVLAHEAIL